MKIAFAVPGDITTLTGGYIYDLRLMDSLIASGVTVQHMAWGDSFPDARTQDAAAALAQLHALPEDQPALIDGLAYGALDTAGLRLVRAPLFALVHHPLALEPGLDPAQARAMALRERDNLSLARHVFVTSPHTAGLLIRDFGVGPERITVVRPGFAPPVAVGTLAPADPPLILSVGILARRKGHDILLQALAQITDLDWQADIVGRDHEPGMTAHLAAMIGDLHLGARVRLSGEVTREALAARYGRATVFALATRYEGYGIVFGEAMGHGLPIVSTRVGAVPETVGEQAGLLVPPEDPAAFAGALRRLLGDSALRGACARASLQAATSLADWAGSARLVRDRMVPEMPTPGRG